MKLVTGQSIVALVLAAMLLAVAPFATAQDSPRIGYVDMKRLLDEAPQVRAARTRLETEFAARDAKLNEDQQRLDALRSKLEKDRGQLSASELANRQAAIDSLAASVRRARERMQQELKTRSTQELDRSWQIISNAAVEYARTHGYDLLVPSPVIYASPRIDITDAVLERLNQEAAESRGP